MRKLTQKQLDNLAIAGIDSRINEWNFLLQETKQENDKQKIIQTIKEYQKIKRELV